MSGGVPSETRVPLKFVGAQIADPIIIGQVAGLFGTHGWLKILSYCRPRAHIFDYGDWWIGRVGHWAPFQVTAHKTQGKALLVALSDVIEREQALELLRLSIAVPHDALQRLPQDEYYWTDLIGAVVTNAQGVELGSVKRLADGGHHDTLVIHGQREYLIPCVLGVYILDVDVGRIRIQVDWHHVD